MKFGIILTKTAYESLLDGFLTLRVLYCKQLN